MHKLKYKKNNFSIWKQYNWRFVVEEKPSSLFRIRSWLKSMLRFGGYLLRFHLASDWSRNNKHSRNFLWCSRFYGNDCKHQMNVFEHDWPLSGHVWVQNLRAVFPQNLFIDFWCLEQTCHWEPSIYSYAHKTATPARKNHSFKRNLARVCKFNCWIDGHL